MFLLSLSPLSPLSPLSGLDDARLEEDMEPVLSTVGLEEMLFMSSF